MTTSLRHRLTLAFVLALALLPAAAARADHGPVFLDESVTAYMFVAQVHWGAAPATCVAEAGGVPVHAALFNDPDPQVVARAEQPGCRLWLDRDFWPARASRRGCIEFVHEWGHLLGYGHEASGLMAPDALGVVPGCLAFGRPKARGLARSGARLKAARRCWGVRGSRAFRPARAWRCRLGMKMRRAG